MWNSCRVRFVEKKTEGDAFEIFYEMFLIWQKLYLTWSQFNKNIVGI